MKPSIFAVSTSSTNFIPLDEITNYGSVLLVYDSPTLHHFLHQSYPLITCKKKKKKFKERNVKTKDEEQVLSIIKNGLENFSSC